MAKISVGEPRETHLPGGTVTFLFTDIEGSTNLLKQLGEDYAALLADQRYILRDAFADHGGREVDTQGDAFFVSFARARDAVVAVSEAQQTLADHDWPGGVDVRVRMGLHTGEPWLVEEGYVGMDVHRAARIAHAGHGGQVLLSETTSALVRDELPQHIALRDLGRFRLKDMRRPEHIHQLVIPGLPDVFPPLKSLEVVVPTDDPLEAVEARPPRAVGASPYRGLAAFQEDDAPFFHGREAFTDQLHEAICRRHLAAVIVGPSGSGKSSTVFAGLIPQLREESGWLIHSMRPGAYPFHALATSLLGDLEPDLDETDRLIASQKLADAMAAGDVQLTHTVPRLLGKSPGASRLLLMIDQFEELYTLCSDVSMREAFLDELLAAVAAGAAERPNPVAVLLTLRADFMGQALTHRPFADALQEGSLMLGPMNREELRAAIEKPAELQGAAFEAGLVSRILDDVGEEPGNLPLLEFALTLLWEDMDQGWMTHAVYEHIGRVEGALARYADEVYAGLDAEEQEEARRAFVQLVQPGQGTEDTRRVAQRADLVGVDWGLVQHLADRRLVVTGVDEAGQETVEVVHEALIRGWGQLRVWMAADRAFRNWQEGLRASLRTWQASGRDTGALLRGLPLAQAEEWLSQRPESIGPSEVAFIEASVAERQAREEAELARQERERALERRSLQRLRAIVMVLALASVVGIILILAVVNQSRIAQQNEALAVQNAATAEAEALARATQEALAIQQAQLATARELAAGAVANLNVDPERSILLALASLAETPTEEAEEALHRALAANRVILTLKGHEAQLNDVAFSPDGTRLATASADGTVKFWDAGAGKELATLPDHEDWINRLDFSPDGQYLITASDDGTARIWDLASGRTVHVLDGHQSNVAVDSSDMPAIVTDAAYSPDGTLVATASNDGTARIWDASTGNELLSIDGGGPFVSGVAFSPDGSRLALVGGNALASVVEIATGQEVLALEGHPEQLWIGVVIFSSDGAAIATLGQDGIRVWDADSGEEVANFPVDATSIAFSPDGSRLAFSSVDGTARILDLPTRREVLALPGHGDRVWGVHFSPDGNRLVTASSDLTARVWDLSPTREALTLQPFGEQPLDDVASVTLSPDGTVLAAGSFLGPVVLWDARSGEELLTIDEHQDFVGGLAFNPQGSRLVTGSDDDLAIVWDATTGEELLTLAGHGGDVNNVAVSPDGVRIATVSSDKTARIWDGETAATLQIMPLLAEAWGIAFSPDGTLLATSAIDGSVAVWDVETGRSVHAFQHLPNAYKIAFSPDGDRLYTSALDGSVKAWEMTTGEQLSHWKAHQSLIWGLAISPDGSELATAAGDGRARLWDATDGELNLTLEAHQEPLTDVMFSPDGTKLVTASRDGTVRVFVLSIEELTELAKSRLTRTMTVEECHTYLHREQCPEGQ